MDMDKIELESEIERYEKELATVEYDYDHTADAAKRASLVKSIDFWSERTADAYHRLSLYEDAEDEDEGKPFDPFDGLLSSESASAEEMTPDEIEELFSESKASDYYD